MPLWRIYSHAATFDDEQRAGLAKAITDLYVVHVGLPAFYVNVLFIPLNENEVWIGGIPKKNFVRITIEQIARKMDDPVTDQGRQARKWWMDLINETLEPFLSSRPDIEWEHHIAETPRDLWRIQGFEAPPAHSEAEKEWARTNKPAAWILDKANKL